VLLYEHEIATSNNQIGILQVCLYWLSELSVFCRELDSIKMAMNNDEEVSKDNKAFFFALMKS